MKKSTCSEQVADSELPTLLNYWPTYWPTGLPRPTWFVFALARLSQGPFQVSAG